MNNLRRALVAVIGAVALSAPLAASALPQYPDPPVSVDVDVDVCSGDPVTFTGTAATSGDWSVTLDGVTRTGTAAEFVAEFPVEGVPQASAPVGSAASASEAAYDLGATAVLPAIAPGETETLTYTFSNAAGSLTQSTQVSIPLCGEIGDNSDGIDGGLSDADADANNGLAGLLPNTGGPAWWILLVGLVLVVGGATVALRTRRS